MNNTYRIYYLSDSHIVIVHTSVYIYLFLISLFCRTSQVLHKDWFGFCLPRVLGD